MEQTVSRRAKRDTFSAPRLLTGSEIDSLRRDAISISCEIKQLMAARQMRQARSIRKLMVNRPTLLAAE